MNAWRAGLLALALAVLAGCGRDAPTPAPAKVQPSSGAPFTILAGSELRELEPAIVAAGRETGLDVKMHYAGTLDIVERMNAGERFDAILPPNGAYPSLGLERKPLAREKLFYSRVALGVTRAKAAELGWATTSPTWTAIADAAKSGRFRYAMTNPSTSNTGMSALFAVASAIARKTEDLTVADVDVRTLKDFLRGQQVTAGSSGWLADAYLNDPRAVDGIVNYEAVILQLNQKLGDADKLVLIYPQDGVISADYPLMLMNETRRDDYRRLVNVLKASKFQGGPVAAAFLRPSSPDVAANKALPTATVAELAFPNRLDVIDEVLTAYQGEWRRPSTSIFVLDVSGSMEGERLAAMRDALKVLAGADAAPATARYARFQNREQVALIAFSTRPAPSVWVRFEPDTIDASRAQVRRFADDLKSGGETAIYAALSAAESEASRVRRTDAQRFVSIVLLTDGESNRGLTLDEFKQRHRNDKSVRIFPILFGDANVKEMHELAAWSGGRTFDSRQASLARIFKEIRGYQ